MGAFYFPFQARKYKADRILFPRGYRPLFYRGKDTVIITINPSFMINIFRRIKPGGKMPTS